MKKSSSIIIAIIVIVILAGGGYAVFHKSSKKMSSSVANQSSGTAVIMTKTDASLGQYLADSAGKALYTYGADSAGVSNCTGSCLAAWPAYIDTGATTNLPTGITVIKRTDNGKMQYAYMGMPLYYFASDSQGHVTGNGVGNFQVAKPSAATSTQSTPAPAATTPAQANANNNPSSNYPY